MKTLYECGFCHSIYDNQEKCLICEALHKTPKIRPGGMKWLGSSEVPKGFPDEVELECDGIVMRYVPSGIRH